MRIKTEVFVITFFLFSSFTFGQNLPKNTDGKSDDLKQTTKIDEFGDISERDLAPRLKKFAEILGKNDSAIGYVIFYNDFNSTPFRKTNYFADEKLKSYFEYLLPRWQGIEPARLVYIAGGLREKMTTELWIVPPNNKVPEISNSLAYDNQEKYKLVSLGTAFINLSDSENCILYNCGKGLIEDVNKDKTLRAILYFYADKEKYDIQKWQRIIENELKINLKDSNIDLAQFTVAFGGYRSKTQIQTWIIPKNGIEPEAMPDEKIEEN